MAIFLKNKYGSDQSLINMKFISNIFINGAGDICCSIESSRRLSAIIYHHDDQLKVKEEFQKIMDNDSEWIVTFGGSSESVKNQLNYQQGQIDCLREMILCQPGGRLSLEAFENYQNRDENKLESK